jgi:hypothetical protein
MDWRQAMRRFTHIDATFVDARASWVEGEDSFFRVSFYAWWEHPLYRRAVEEGRPWGITQGEGAERTVTMVARGLVEAKLSRQREVVEWCISDEHPLLWSHDPTDQIIVNGPVDVSAFLDALSARIGADPARWMNPLVRRGVTPPFSLGSFPRSISDAARAVLSAQGVPVAPLGGPALAVRDPMVALVIDDEDYMIANDFVCELEDEFTHDPAWFTPR